MERAERNGRYLMSASRRRAVAEYRWTSSSQSGESQVSYSPGLDQEPRDAALLVAGHVDHAPTPREAILVARLQDAEPAVTRVHGQLAFLDLPGVRHVDFVVAVCSGVFGEPR